MIEKRQFYIDGKWVNPIKNNDYPVINPATEEDYAVISLGGVEDINKAVSAAKNAFLKWSQTTPEERLGFVERILEIYKRRITEMAEAISHEMGAPAEMALSQQAKVGQVHIEDFIAAFKNFKFVRPLNEQGEGALVFDSIGVVGLITPWNWPMNQVTLKVIPALLAGCTMILKPSEIAPMSSLLMAEFIDEAGVPAGVFNLVNGDGPGVGSYLSGHSDVEMISFTGSTRAGISISQNAAKTLKRVVLELGGKGANIIFADADEAAVKRGIAHCFNNSGQSCNAPTRMLIERPLYQKAVEFAKTFGASIQVGDPRKIGAHIGPVVSKQQFDKIENLIQTGIDEGATLLCGGIGRPDHLSKGYYVRPTIFSDVHEDMRIYKEEIFGPVLCMMPFDSEEQAIALANDTQYGLTNYIQSQDQAKCRRVARVLRSGMVAVNGKGLPRQCFFGGVKSSGRAREGGIWGIEEFLDSKAVSQW